MNRHWRIKTKEKDSLRNRSLAPTMNQPNDNKFDGNATSELRLHDHKIPRLKQNPDPKPARSSSNGSRLRVMCRSNQPQAYRPRRHQICNCDVKKRRIGGAAGDARERREAKERKEREEASGDKIRPPG